MFTVIICAALIGLIPAAIARSKGHSFVGWWVYGAAFWIIAFPHSLFLKANREELDRRNFEAGLRRCPACMEWIQGPATICRYCGLTTTSADANSTASEQSGVLVTSARPIGQRASAVRPTNPAKRTIVLVVIIALIGIAVIIASVFSSVHRADTLLWASRASDPSGSEGAEDKPTAASGSDQIPTSAAPSVVLSLSGSGSKSTRTITVSNEWSLSWTYDCSNFGPQGNFQVFIYDADGTPSSATGINQLGSRGSDTEYFHQGGNLYLEINSECRWSIKVLG
jgi:hypothetical protein